MYLLADRIEEVKEQTSYEPDMLGPYSEVIDEESNYLKDIGIFNATEGQISLTDQGIEVANEIEKKEKPEIKELISDFKQFLNNLTSSELLCYVYSAYPEMTEESVEYNRLLPIMEDTILNLVKKQKISMGRAAELLNKKHDYVINRMKEKGIKVLS